ncbi:MAG TPA: GTPase domain-containing protein [Candidatus Angelobacter sp.]|jgi:hypothetical protein
MANEMEVTVLQKGVEIAIQYGLPKILDRAKMFWSGKRFLVLGPPRCGKTNFLNFLETLVLEPERYTDQTVRVIQREDQTLNFGEYVTLRARRPLDVPGQNPTFQIEYIKDFVPNCIVVVLDATRFWGTSASLEWIEEFCRHLDILLRSNKKVVRKLKLLVVVLNKWDKIPSASPKDDQDNREIFDNEIRAVLDRSFNNEFCTKGKMDNVRVVPCALVKSPLGEELAIDLLKIIGTALR